ncbi:carbonic anhydrase, partial [Sarracenia purpurea var. burkii]
LPLLFGYYAYYDSYIDLVTGKQYPCAINILADRTVYVLSELQDQSAIILLPDRPVAALSESQNRLSRVHSLHRNLHPEKSYSPINIITKDAIRANVSSPVNLRNGVYGPLLVKNTGYAFEAYGNPEVISGGIVYGGVLCGELFRFHKLRTWVSQDPDGRSYNQINGKGSPLTIAIQYYNAKYGSFKEGLRHADGVVVINYMITYGPVYNLLFLLPDIALHLLFRYPSPGLYFGPEIFLYAWFNIIFLIDEYYAFRGSYLELETGKEYPNVIQIQTAGIIRYLRNYN